MATTSMSADLDSWIQELSAFFHSPIRSVGSRWFELGLSSSKWALRILIVIVALVLCLFTASLIFAWIYFTMMPVKHLEKPVYFDFSKESPEALVSLMGNQWQYKTPSPYNLQPVMTFLTSGVPYDVDVEFTLANQVASSQTGMLMLEATAEYAYREQIQIVAHSKRPIELSKIPSAVRLIRDSFMLPPMLIGLYSPSTRVKTRVFERFVDYQQFPISTMNLTLIRAPTHRGEIHLTNAMITFTLHLSGWRFIFYDYFWTSAFVMIPVLSILLFLLALTSYFTMMMKPTIKKETVEEDDSTTRYESTASTPKTPSSMRSANRTPSKSKKDSITLLPPKTGIIEDEDEALLADDSAGAVDGSQLNENLPTPLNTQVVEEEEEEDDDQGSNVPLISGGTNTEQDDTGEQTINDFEHISNDFEDDITLASSSDNDGGNVQQDSK